MAQRPRLVYPPSGTAVAPHAPVAPHPPVRPGAPPAPHDPLAGDIAIAPVVSYVAVDPPPPQTAGQPRPAGLRARAGRAPGPARALALAGLCCLFLLLLLALALHHQSGGAPAQSAPAPGGAAPGGAAPGGAAPAGGARPAPARGGAAHPAAHGAARPAGFTLPGPLGDAPRTVPLDTIWVIDSALPPGDLRAVARQAPADVAYLARYSLPGDELGFSRDQRHLRHVAARESWLARTAARPALILSALPGGLVRLPPVPQGHDREIVVITTRPAAWLRVLPAGPVPPRPTTRPRPGQSRLYIIGLAPGAGYQADPLSAGPGQPQRLTADPAVPGAIARGIARAFVDATGARWPA